MKSRKKEYSLMDTPQYSAPQYNAPQYNAPHILVWKNDPELKHVKKLTCDCDGSIECQYSGGATSRHIWIPAGEMRSGGEQGVPYTTLPGQPGPQCRMYHPRPGSPQHVYRYPVNPGRDWRPLAAPHLAVTKQRHNYYRAPLSPSGNYLRNRQQARRQTDHLDLVNRRSLPVSGAHSSPALDDMRPHSGQPVQHAVYPNTHFVYHSCFVDKQTSVGTPPRSQSADNLTSTEGETIGTPSSTSADNIPDTPTCHPASIDHTETSADTPTANGDMKVGSGVIEGSASVKTPPPERKASKLSAFSRLFKPWKWRKRKKPSEKIEKTAVGK